MGSEMNWDLVLRILDGSSSEADQEELRRWIDSDEQNRKVVDQLRLIWNTISTK